MIKDMGVAGFGANPREPGTWREGDIRFYIDGDTDCATISGTGWSDWFLSAYGIGLVNSIYGGCTDQVMHLETGNKHFCSCYRFHVMDPNMPVTHLKQGCVYQEVSAK